MTLKQRWTVRLIALTFLITPLVVLGAATIPTGCTIPGDCNLLTPALESLSLPATTGSGIGVIYKGSTPFMHNFTASGSIGRNTFVGLNAGHCTLSLAGNPSYYTSFNTAVGASALASNTIGFINTAVGNGALAANTTGLGNTAVGNGALGLNTAGTTNNAFGVGALGNTTAGANDAFGYNALNNTTTGASNIAMGNSALGLNTTGSQNTAIGDGAGYGFHTLSNSTFLGEGATSTVDGITNSTAIGNGSLVTASNQVVIGNTSVTQTLLNGNVGIGKTSPAAKLDVVGTISGSTVIGTHGLTTNVVAVACDDTTSQATNGTVCIDSADGGRIYFRYGNAWHYVSQTAGFQIPHTERNGVLETNGLSVGDLVIGRIDEVMQDGALHGVWEKLDLKAELLKTLRENPDLLKEALAGADPRTFTAGK